MKHRSTWILVAAAALFTLTLLFNLPYGPMDWRVLAQSSPYLPTATPVVLDDSFPDVWFLPEDEVVGERSTFDNGLPLVYPVADQNTELFTLQSDGSSLQLIIPFDDVNGTTTIYGGVSLPILHQRFLGENLSAIPVAERLVESQEWTGNNGERYRLDIYVLDVFTNGTVQLQLNLYRNGELIDDSIEVFLNWSGVIVRRRGE